MAAVAATAGTVLVEQQRVKQAAAEKLADDYSRQLEGVNAQIAKNKGRSSV